MKSLSKQNAKHSLRTSQPHTQSVRWKLTTRVMSTCISTILRELESATEPALSAILKTPWKDLENVSGRSAYVVDLVSSIKQVAEVVRSRVEAKKYIRNFADKAVGYVQLTGWADGRVVITRFTGAVIKSRPLKRVGAEQVSPRSVHLPIPFLSSLDRSMIKVKVELMIDPPRCPSGKSMSPRFTRTASRECNKYVSPVPFLLSFL